MIWKLTTTPPKKYKEVLGMDKDENVYLVDLKSDGNYYDTKIFSTKRDIVKWCEIIKSEIAIETAAIPLINYLGKLGHSNFTAIVTSTSCKLLEDIKDNPTI